MSGELRVVEGPAYQVRTEDGPATRWDFFVATADGRFAPVSFRWADEAAEYAKTATPTAEWTVEQDPWYAYHGGLTLEERWAPFGPDWQREQEGSE